MMNSHHGETTRAILFTSQQCPHCPSVKRILQSLQQAGKLAALEIFDITEHQQEAEQYQVRAVPWFKIGDLVFQGLHTASELEYWVENACTDAGILNYMIEKLKEGKLTEVESLIKQHPTWLNIAMQIVADIDTPLQARIGLGAILEGLAGSQQLNELLPALEELARHTDHRVRGDACHYLGFIKSPKSKEILKHCLDDEHEEVREIAQDSLDNFD
ncbi:MAG: HEAT repeat domain-containing protein [Thioalkalispiraceae bacterium]|jgi:glutaredoxin